MVKLTREDGMAAAIKYLQRKWTYGKMLQWGNWLGKATDTLAAMKQAQHGR